MAVAGVLLNLLNKKQELNQITALQIQYSNWYTSNHDKYERQAKYKETYDDSYDDAIGNEKDLKATNKRTGEVVEVSADNTNTVYATAYAEAKAPYYDETVYEELLDKDNLYDSMKTLYETEAKSLEAEIESLEQLVEDRAGDTGLLGS